MVFNATLNRVNYEICVCKESATEGHTDKETPRGARKAFVTSELWRAQVYDIPITGEQSEM